MRHTLALLACPLVMLALGCSGSSGQGADAAGGSDGPEQGSADVAVGTTADGAEDSGGESPEAGSTPTEAGADGAGRAGESGADTGGAACTTNSDCGASHPLCGFPEAAACAATGTCFPMPGATCNAIVLACACDGTPVNIACNGLPSGYAPKPVAHSGTCGLDSGSGG